MKTLIFVEQRAGKLKTSAFEALTVGSKAAGSAAEAAALVIGSNVEGLAKELAGYGVDHVLVVDAPDLEKYNALHYVTALETAVKQFGAKLVVGAASPMGRDLFARAAARLDAGIITDAVELSVSGETVNATKPMYAGKVLAEMSLENAAVSIVSIRSNVFGAQKSGQGAANIQKVSVTLNTDKKLVTTDIRKGKSEKPDLTEASLIVSGGRAMGNADNFKLLHDCAEVIGATVGASRAAVDSGYATHDMQVGQTGKTVNPNLYIACGISGSIQHMAGMRTSKVIVAINTDSEAPIFGIANYGIVADLFQAVPILKEELKKLTGH